MVAKQVGLRPLENVVLMPAKHALSPIGAARPFSVAISHNLCDVGFKQAQAGVHLLHDAIGGLH